MSKSTPSDLAVAFRSLDRRRRDAIDAADGAPVADLTTELDRLVAEAATLVGAARGGAAVAVAIDARPSAEWDAATLERLRDLATRAGTVLRELAGRGPAGEA